MKTAFDYQDNFFDDFSYGNVLVDRYIDRLHDLLEEGLYSDARQLSNRINDITGVSSSVDRATAF